MFNILLNNIKVIKTILVWFIFICSAIIFLKMLGRSIWIDEGMLLKSIFENSFFDFINPLPYYDQAQPFLVSILHKLVTLISIDLKTIRAFLLIICLVPIIYFVVKISKNENIKPFLLSLVFFSTILTVGFYLTEIKHYSFEIVATFGMIYFVNNFFKEKSSYFTTIVLVSLISTIGFSSIIPACVIILYISLFQLYKEKQNFFTKKSIFGILLSLILIVITYLHMKHLTIFQISNHDVYLSKGIFDDIKSLAGAALGAYGKVFILVSAFSSVAVLFYANKKSFLFHLNNIFLLTVIIVTLAKLIGVYPVISDRHIVWIVPFNILIVTLFLNAIYQDKNNKMKILFALILIALFVQVVNIAYKSFTTQLNERTANNNLYSFVEKMEPSLFVIHPWTKPSLDYYEKTTPVLTKHTYIDIKDNRKSKLKHSTYSKDHYLKVIDSLFDEIKVNDFYFLISHLVSFEAENLDETSLYRMSYVKDKLLEKNCSYQSIFIDNNVQILKVECQSATNPKP